MRRFAFEAGEQRSDFLTTVEPLLQINIAAIKGSENFHGDEHYLGDGVWSSDLGLVDYYDLKYSSKAGPVLHFNLEEHVSSETESSSLTCTGTPGAFLWMDGAYLNVVNAEKGTIEHSFQAFSGKPGMTADDTAQHQKNSGPTPEGLYYIDQDNTLSQETAKNAWDWIKWEAKSPAWGYFATPLRPVADTATHGRAGFYIHGGHRPGSIGCIDLTGRNKDFHKWFANRRKPAPQGRSVLMPEVKGDLLLVHYLDLAKKIPRTHDDPTACPEDPNKLYCTISKYCSRNAAYAGPQSGYQAERNAELHRILKDLLVE
jgi:hypothetical protein